MTPAKKRPTVFREVAETNSSRGFVFNATHWAVLSNPAQLPSKAPCGFNKAVLRHLATRGIDVSNSFITMVRKGKRRNDAVLWAIIEVDHKLIFR